MFQNRKNIFVFALNLSANRFHAAIRRRRIQYRLILYGSMHSLKYYTPTRCKIKECTVRLFLFTSQRTAHHFNEVHAGDAIDFAPKRTNVRSNRISRRWRPITVVNMLQRRKTQFICSLTYLEGGVRNTINYQQIIYLLLLRIIFTAHRSVF